MGVSAKTYERVALEDPDGLWELWCGQLRRKPPMTFQHDNAIEYLDYRLKQQLDEAKYSVRTHPVRLRAPSGSYYIPDLCVIPRGAARQALIERGLELAVYDDPMPLVVEVWSPSTGSKDLNLKLAEYRDRGDGEIWFVHPRRRTLTIWRRQPGGTYTRTQHTAGTVELTTLPAARIVVSELFEPV
jgi:Uma2 family endonuclease